MKDPVSIDKIVPGTELWYSHGGTGVRKVLVLSPPRVINSNWNNSTDKEYCTVRRFDHFKQKWGTRFTAYIPYMREQP